MARTLSPINKLKKKVSSGFFRESLLRNEDGGKIVYSARKRVVQGITFVALNPQNSNFGVLFFC